MRAMVLKATCEAEKGPLVQMKLPVPEPKGSEILIKVSVCGACHTDLDTAEGRVEPSKLPIVLGHQVVGTVAKRGDDAQRFGMGNRVGATWLAHCCGACWFCETGQENLCEGAKWTGKDVDGGYAEYMLVEEDFAYPIPAVFDDAQAAPLLCSGIIGYRTLRLAQITDGEAVGLFGFGASGHIVIQVIRHKFPHSPVFAFTKTEAHAELARKLGACWTGRSGEQPPKKLNKIIDFTPMGECVRDALSVLDKGGRLIINAIRKQTPIPPLDYAELLWWEREIKSVANVTRRDAEEFLPLAAQIGITPTVQEFRLEQANEVLLRIKNSQVRGAAVLRVS